MGGANDGRKSATGGTSGFHDKREVAGPMLGECWASAVGDGPTLAQHCPTPRNSWVITNTQLIETMLG